MCRENPSVVLFREARKTYQHFISDEVVYLRDVFNIQEDSGFLFTKLYERGDVLTVYLTFFALPSQPELYVRLLLALVFSGGHSGVKRAFLHITEEECRVLELIEAERAQPPIRDVLGTASPIERGIP